MNTSQEYKNIYSAIIKMRTEIVPVTKTKRASMPKYSYNYATLDSVIELLNIVIPKHGLGWVQTIGTQDGKTTLTTRIIHESGEWIEDTLALPASRPDGGKNENQELGASITYFKRYALSAMFGIATDEDTDGMADVRERKQMVKAQARAAGQAQADAPEAAGTEGAERLTAKSTGDGAVDRAIADLINSQHRGRPLFSDKTVAWLNGIIEKKSPQEALASANTAAGKRINEIEKETAA